MRRALGIYRALGSTIRRHSDVILQARTGWAFAPHLAIGVRAAGGRLTGVGRYWWLLCNEKVRG